MVPPCPTFFFCPVMRFTRRRASIEVMPAGLYRLRKPFTVAGLLFPVLGKFIFLLACGESRLDEPAECFRGTRLRIPPG